MSTEYLDVAGVAERCQITPDTVRSYRKTGYMPPPDTYFGRSPVWNKGTIERWQADREKRWAKNGKPF